MIGVIQSFNKTLMMAIEQGTLKLDNITDQITNVAYKIDRLEQKQTEIKKQIDGYFDRLERVETQMKELSDSVDKAVKITQQKIDVERHVRMALTALSGGLDCEETLS